MTGNKYRIKAPIVHATAWNKLGDHPAVVPGTVVDEDMTMVYQPLVRDDGDPVAGEEVNDDDPQDAIFVCQLKWHGWRRVYPDFVILTDAETGQALEAIPRIEFERKYVRVTDGEAAL